MFYCNFMNENALISRQMFKEPPSQIDRIPNCKIMLALNNFSFRNRDAISWLHAHTNIWRSFEAVRNPYFINHTSPQVVMATACSLLHRFYYLNSLRRHPLRVFYSLNINQQGTIHQFIPTDYRESCWAHSFLLQS